MKSDLKLTEADERLIAQVAKDHTLRLWWDEFASQGPCAFKSMRDCKMHAHFNENRDAIAQLKNFETFKAYKRLTK